MDWIESEPFGVTGPYAAGVFVWRETLEGLEATGEVVGRDEVVEMTAQLVMAVVVEAFDGRPLDGSVYPLDLSISPRMIGLCQAMLDAVALTRGSNGWPLNRAVGPLRFFGRSANWMPLSVSTIRMS